MIIIMIYNNNDLLTDPLGVSSLLNYINYNYKINQIEYLQNMADHVKFGKTEFYSVTSNSVIPNFISSHQIRKD